MAPAVSLPARFQRHPSLTRGSRTPCWAPALFLVLLGGTSLPQSGRAAPPAPWSDLEPVLRGADQILVGRVTAADLIPAVGLQVTLQVEEHLQSRHAAPRRLSYLADGWRVVRAGERELVLLRNPRPGGILFSLMAKVNGRDRNLEAKISWMKAVLALLQGPASRRGRTLVRFYLAQACGKSPWARERALAELERLRARKAAEFRGVLPIEALKEARKACGDPAARGRLEALLAWRSRPASSRPSQ